MQKKQKQSEVWASAAEDRSADVLLMEGKLDLGFLEGTLTVFVNSRQFLFKVPILEHIHL